MNLLGAFILGGATAIACYELAWCLAGLRLRRLQPAPVRPSALPPIYFDAGPTRLEQMRVVVERES